MAGMFVQGKYMFGNVAFFQYFKISLTVFYMLQTWFKNQFYKNSDKGEQNQPKKNRTKIQKDQFNLNRTF